MRTPELLVFDLDGTLIDSSRDLCLSVNAMLGAFGRAELPFPTIASYIGDGAAALVRRALEATEPLANIEPLPSRRRPVESSARSFEQAYDFFIRFYRKHKLDNTKLYDGAGESLAAIRARAPDVLMAVLTNKPVHPSRDICQGLGVDRIFFQNYGGDSFASKKPDPEGLLALIDEANGLRRKQSQGTLDLAQIVMIGDSGVDVETARRAGVRSLGCMFGLAPESLQQCMPDLRVQHASEWPAVLGFAAAPGGSPA